MSNNFNNTNPALASLRRLSDKFDGQGEQMNNFMAQQTRGENPDPHLFMKLLEQRATTSEAMQAQFKLHEKPLKTVMNETK